MNHLYESKRIKLVNQMDKSELVQSKLVNRACLEN